MCLPIILAVHDLQGGHRGLACHVLASELQSSYLQLPAQQIFADHCLGCLFCQFNAHPSWELGHSRYPVRNCKFLLSTSFDGAGCWLLAACRASSGSQGCHRTSLLCPLQPLMHHSSQANLLITSLITFLH